MRQIFDVVSQYHIEIIMGLSAIVLFLFILTIASQFRISKMTKKYNRLVEGVNEATLEDMLIQHLDQVQEVKGELSSIKKYCDELDSRLKLAVQKVGIVRYNAFNDMGSDLSFSFAMLDDHLNGFVLSSIFGRNECNTYAKPILAGKSSYTLSVEEIQALDRAKHSGTSSSTKSKIS